MKFSLFRLPQVGASYLSRVGCILAFVSLTTILEAQCPFVEFIMIDGCVSGSEPNNEYLVINGGSTGFLIDDLTIDYNSSNNSIGPANNDINVDFNNWPADPTPCGLQAGDPANVTGCANVVSIGPGETLPPNALLFVQTSANMNIVVDISGLCQGGQTVYIVSSTCNRTVGAFTNSGSGTRTTNFTFGGGCSESVTYDRSQLSGNDGDYYGPSLGYGNSANCAAPILTTTCPDSQFESVELCVDGPILPSPYILSDADPLFTEADVMMITYHLSQQDAENGVNDVDTYGGSTDNPQLFFVRVEYADGCVVVGELTLIFIQPDGNAGTDGAATICSGDVIDLLALLGGGVTAGSFSDDDGSGVNLSNPSSVDFAGVADGVYAFTYTANDDPGTPCLPATSVVTITVEPAPVVTTPSIDFVICYNIIPPFLDSNIDDVIDQINGSTGDDVVFYFDAAGTEVFTLTLANIQQLIFTGQNTLFAEVRIGNCSSPLVPVSISLNNRPEADSAGPLTACDDGSGTGSFDLNSLSSTINGGSGQTVTFYTDPGLQNPINTNPYQSGTTTVFATVGDAACQSESVAIQLNLLAPLEIDCQIISDASTPTSNDGEVAINIFGGSAPYILTVAGPNGTTTIDPASNPENLTGLAPGTYTVTLSDGTGCPTVFCSFTIDVDVSCTLDVAPTLSNPLCNGAADGEIELAINGQLGNLDIQWSVPGFDGQTTASGLSAGTYSVTVTDDGGTDCEVIIADMVLVDPLPIQIACDELLPETPAGAANGQAEINIAFAVEPIVLAVTGPSSQTLTNQTNGTITIDNLAAGTYQVLLTDDNGCEETCTFEISSIDCPDQQIEIFEICVDGDFLDPPVSILPAEVLFQEVGVASVSFHISSSDAEDDINPQSTYGGPTTSQIGYFARVEYDNGCVVIGTLVLQFQQLDGNAGASGSANICSGDVVNMFALLGPGTTIGSFNDDDGSGVNLSNPSSVDFTGVADGTYQFTYTAIDDPNTSCPADESVLTINVETRPLANAAGPLTACDNGSGQGSFDLNSLIATINGGSGETVGFYTDINLQNPINVNPFVSGTTTVYAAVGGGNCPSLPVAIDLTVFAPLELVSCQVVANASTSTSSDGEALVVITGGSPDYVLTVSSTNGSFDINPAVSPQSITGLAPGNYTVTVTDSEGCLATSPCNFTIGVQPSCDLVVLTNEVSDPTCFGGSDGFLELILIDEVGPVSIQWSVPGFDDQLVLDNLSEGSYSVTVTDTGVPDCTIEILSLSLFDPPEIQLSCSELQAELPAGAANGQAELIISDAIDFNTVVVSGPVNQTLTNVANGTLIVENLTAGDYTVILTDANGCTTDCSFTISGVTCPGSQNETFFICVDGDFLDPPVSILAAEVLFQETGVTGVSFHTTLGDAENNVNPQSTYGGPTTSSVSYFARVVYDNGCVVIGTLMLDFLQPDGDAGANGSATICSDEVVDLLALLGPGVTAGSFNDDDGSGVDLSNPNSVDFTGVNDGIYEYTYTTDDDPNTDCTPDQSVLTITVEGAPIANPAGPLSACNNGDGTGNFDLSSLNSQVNGGSGNMVNFYSDILLQNPINANPFVSNPTTVYATVMVGNCESAAQPIELQLLMQPQLSCSEIAQELPIGAGNGAAEIIVSDAAEPATLVITGPSGQTLINQSNGTITINNLSAGTYQVLLTDNNGCEETCTFEITSIDCPDAQTQTFFFCVDGPVLSPAESLQPAEVLFQEAGVVDVSFHNTFDEAVNGINEVQGYGGDASSPVSFFARVVYDNGCVVIGTLILEFLQPDGNAGANGSAAICSGDVVDLLALLGAGVTAGSFSDDDGSGVDLSDPSSVDFGGVNAGTYLFTYTTDDDPSTDCAPDQAMLTIIVNMQPQLSCGELSAELPSGAGNGEAGIVISDAAEPIVLVVTGPSGQTLTDQTNGTITIENLSAGTYQVLLTDDNGCEATCTFEITAIDCADPQTQTFFFCVDGPVLSPAESLQPAEVLFQEVGVVDVSFHNTFNQAVNGINEVQGYGGDASSPVSFFARVVYDNGCVVVGTLILEFLQPDGNAGASGSATICSGDVVDLLALLGAGVTAGAFSDDDGSGVDLSDPSSVDFGGVSDGNYAFTYTTDDDPNTDCIPDQSVLTITVETRPDANAAGPLNACDDGSGQGSFDLNSLIATINGGSGETVNFFTDIDLQNPINVNPFESGTSTVYAVVSGGSCPSLPVAIELVLLEPLEIVSCQVIANASTSSSSDGEALVVITGGLPDYVLTVSSANGSFDINPAVSPQSITGLAPGTYTVTVTDSEGCLTSDPCNFVIGVQPSCDLVVTPNIFDPVCFGGSDGSIALDITGQVGTIAVQWSVPGFDDQQTLTGLGEGSYSVTVTDDGVADCEIELFFLNVDNPDEIQLVCSESAPELPAGEANGQAELIISDAVDFSTVVLSGPVNQTITDVANGTLIVNDLSEGFYTVTLTDANGCTADCSFEISAVDCPATQSQDFLVCVDGPEVSIPFSLAPAQDLFLEPGVVNVSFHSELIEAVNDTDEVGFLGGNTTSPVPFFARVEYDNGCVAIGIMTVIYLQPDGNAGEDVQELVCFGETVNLLALLGPGISSGSFSDNDGSGVDLSDPTSVDFSGVATGTYEYMYTVDDDPGTDCLGDSSVVTITLGSQILIDCQVIADASTANSNDGEASVGISGGAPDYVLNVSGPNGSFTLDPGSNFEILSNLAAGDYTVSVTDNENCTVSDACTFTIGVEPPSCAPPQNELYVFCTDGGPVLDPPGDLTLADILFQETGVIDVSFHASVDDALAGINEITSYNGQTTMPVTYSARVEYDNGCVVIGTLEIFFEINNANPGSDAEAEVCVGEVVNLIDLIGPVVSPGTFSDDDGSGVDLNDPTNVSFAGVAVGTYQYTYTTDAVPGSNCPIETSVTTINVSQPIANPAGPLSACDGGVGTASFDLNSLVNTINGGTGEPVTFYLDITLQVEVPVNPFTTFTTTVFAAVGEADCQSVPQPIDLIVESLPQLSCQVLTNASTSTSADGVANVEITGGSPNYSLTIDGPGGNFSIDPATNPQILTGLSIGNYTVTATDANGCSSECDFDVNVLDCSVLTITENITPASCAGNDAAIVLTVTGNTLPVFVDWDDPDLPDEFSLTGLSSGIYTGIVYEGGIGNCPEEIVLIISSPQDLIINCNVLSNASGPTATDGSAIIAIASGTPPIEIELVGNGQTITDSTSESTYQFNDLGVGAYVVTITDSIGCEQTCNFSIQQDNCPLDLSHVSTDISCEGEEDGTITLFISGNQGTVTIDWDDDTYDGQQDLTGLPAGDYSVTVTDQSGCFLPLGPITIIEPEDLDAVCSEFQSISNPNGDDGQINLNIQGGTGPYTIELTSSDPDFSIIQVVSDTGDYQFGPFAQDVYEFFVTDASGCTSDCFWFLLGPPCPVIAISQDTLAPVSCFEGDDGAIGANITGGNGPYTFDWTPSLPDTNFVDGLTAGQYILVVFDSDSCTAAQSFEILQPSGFPTLDCQVSADESAPGANDGIAEVTTTSPSDSVELILSGPANQSVTVAGNNTQVFDQLPAGNYQVELIDGTCDTLVCTFTIGGNGCDIDIDVSVVDSTICEDECLELNLDFTGTGPFNLNYFVYGQGDTIPGLALATAFQDTILDFCIFQSVLPNLEGMVITSIGNISCDVDTSIQIPLLSLAPDSLLLSNTSVTIDDLVICEDECLEVDIDFAGTAPFEITYFLIFPNVDTLFSNFQTTTQDTLLELCGLQSTPIDVLGFGISQISDVNCSIDTLIDFPLTNLISITVDRTDTLCAGEIIDIGGQQFSITNPADTFSIAGDGITTCDTVFQVGLTFSDPQLSLIPTDADCSQSGSILPAIQDTIDVVITDYDWSVDSLDGQALLIDLPGGLYELTVTNDIGCRDSASIEIQQIDNAPTLIIGPTPNALCENECFELDFTFTGTGPFAVNGFLYGEFFTLPLTFNDIVGDTTLSSCDLGLDLSIIDSIEIEIIEDSQCATLVQEVRAIEILPALTVDSFATFCQDEDILIGGQIFNAANPSDTFSLVGGAGFCDTLFRVDLNFAEPAFGSFTTSACAGDTVFIEGEPFFLQDPDGLIVLENQAANGCDSLLSVIVNFSLPPEIDISGDRTICLGDTVNLGFDVSNGSGLEIVLAQTPGNPLPVNGVNNSTELQLIPEQTTTYSIASATSNNPCPVDFNADDEIVITVNRLTGVLTSGFDQSGFQIRCADENTGSLTLDMQEGEPPFDIQWSSGESNVNELNNLPPNNYSVLVTDDNGCTFEESLLIQAPPPIAADLSILGPGCNSDLGTVTINNISGGLPPYEFSLDGEFFINATSLPYIFDDQPGSYTLQILDGFDCGSELPITIPIGSDPQLNLPSDTVINLGDSLFVVAQVDFNVDSLFWEPAEEVSDPNSLASFLSPESTTFFQLTVIDESGCRVTDGFQIIVDEQIPIFVPSAFSPNNDGNNELFRFYTDTNVEEVIVMRIFNRWGGMVYEENNFSPFDTSKGWDGSLDGQLLNPAVFIYYGELRLSNNEIVIVKGDVTLMR
ncbi:MAG: gliding motility-associated C-terminal domain-containing protein [Bacteroidota bacterium]